MSIEKLRHVTRWTQVQLANFVGVKQPTVHAWLHGKVKPAGVNKVVINLALIIAAHSPDVLEHVRDIEPPAKPFDRVIAFFGEEAGLTYWLDVTAYDLLDEQCSVSMGRLAVMLGLIDALMPDVRTQLVKAFPVIVAQRRASKAAALAESENKAKARRKAKARENKMLRDLMNES